MRSNDNEEPTPHLFFAERSKCLTSLTFFECKIVLAARKIIYLGACNFFNKLTSTCSVKGNNQHTKGTGKIT